MERQGEIQRISQHSIRGLFVTLAKQSRHFPGPASHCFCIRLANGPFPPPTLSVGCRFPFRLIIRSASLPLISFSSPPAIRRFFLPPSLLPAPLRQPSALSPPPSNCYLRWSSPRSVSPWIRLIGPRGRTVRRPPPFPPPSSRRRRTTESAGRSLSTTTPSNTFTRRVTGLAIVLLDVHDQRNDRAKSTF